MKILVTGGAGFIGKSLVNRLRERGEDVKIFDLPNDIRDFPQLKKAEKLLRWQARTSFDEGLKKTLIWITG